MRLAGFGRESMWLTMAALERTTTAQAGLCIREKVDSFVTSCRCMMHDDGSNERRNPSHCV